MTDFWLYLTILLSGCAGALVSHYFSLRSYATERIKLIEWCFQDTKSAQHRDIVLEYIRETRDDD